MFVLGVTYSSHARMHSGSEGHLRDQSTVGVRIKQSLIQRGR
jgi:hypothetical protein